MNVNSLDLVLDQLYARRAHGIKLELDTLRALLNRLGNPQEGLDVVHIAGTNGKGSVAAMLDSIFRAAGYVSGLFTSPHLIRFNERIQLGGVPIRDADLASLIAEIDGHSSAVAADPRLRQPTFFEFTTAVALTHFQRAGANLVVLETGLGGRMDATNVVQSLISVVTSIDVDHVEFLGGNLVEIAKEKAGIIKRRRPVVCGEMDQQARSAIQSIALDLDAPWIDVREEVSVVGGRKDEDGQLLRVESSNCHYAPICLPLLGRHQVANAATAIVVAEAMASYANIEVGQKAICAGLESVRWVGRGEILQKDPYVLVDAAHNPGGAKALRDMLRDVFPGRPVGMVVGMSKDKDIGEFMKSIAPAISRCWIVAIHGPRSADPSTLAYFASQAGLESEEAIVSDAIREAIEWARTQNAVVCIAGSIYLVGEVLTIWPKLCNGSQCNSI